MLRKFVSWFAIVVGLLLVVHNGHAMVDFLLNRPLAGYWYLQVAARALVALAGAALILFGFRRLGRKGAEAD